MTATVDDLTTTRVRWETYRDDGRRLRAPSAVHLIDVTGIASFAQPRYIESAPDTLCGLLVPDPWDAIIDGDPPAAETCRRCTHALRRRQRDAEPPAPRPRVETDDLDGDVVEAHLARYRDLADTLERMTGGMVLTHAPSLRKVKGTTTVIGELLLPRLFTVAEARRHGDRLVAAYSTVTGARVVRDDTGRLRIEAAWEAGN